MERIDSYVSPRYAQIPTFMRLPHERDPRGYDVVVIGAPYDGGTSHRPGARFGPQAIRNESGLVHGVGIDRGCATFDLINCVDGGDMDLTPFDMNIAIETSQNHLSALLRYNAAFLMLGGDHSVTVAALRAVAEQHGPVAVVHLDAHSHTSPASLDGPYHHGTPFRHGIDEKLVEPSAMVQIGIRGHNPKPDSLDYARGHGVRVVTADEFGDLGVRGTADLIRERVDRRPVYVSVDIAVVDPAFAPGTGTPAPGGLSSRELLALLRCVGDLKPVGFDVMEVSPLYDHAGITSLLATEVGAELLHQYARAHLTPA
ncbi:agmatinase [Streptomyces sp. NPDC002785]|uniref:agmatinase n=1 Tax=Streptomyces sp. NPDC002785 TaxID=3154543 RepID=UPI00332A4178